MARRVLHGCIQAVAPIEIADTLNAANTDEELQWAGESQRSFHASGPSWCRKRNCPWAWDLLHHQLAAARPLQCVSMQGSFLRGWPSSAAPSCSHQRGPLRLGLVLACTCAHCHAGAAPACSGDFSICSEQLWPQLALP